MEGQDSNESDPCQGKLKKDLDCAQISMYADIGVKLAYVRDYRGKIQKDLDYSHIPMYTVIGVKPTYVHGYRVKGRVYHFLYSFRDDQGNIKG